MKILLFLTSILLSTQLYSAENSGKLTPEIKKYIDDLYAEKEKSESPLLFNGYFRAGTHKLTSGGGKSSGSCFSLNYPKNDGLSYRLGNECRDYAEFSLSKIVKRNGVEFRPFFMLDFGSDSRSPTATEAWSRRTRQLFVEIKGLFDNGAALWVGRRYYRTEGDIGDIHVIDGTYVQSSGNGVGITDVPLAGGQYNFALIGYGSDDTATNVNEQNYLADIRANYKVDANSYQVALQNLFVSTADNTVNRPEGRTLTLQWQRNFNILSNKVALQLAQGSMAENPGCFGTDGNCFNTSAKASSSAYRVFSNGTFDWGSDFKLHYLALYQDSEDYNTWTSLGIRPHYVLSKYWSLLADIGHNSYEVIRLQKQTLNQYTLALQASTDASQFWDRPSIRFYYSRFDWNNAAALQSTLSVPGRASQKDANVIGAQTEIWF
jgi:maltoporin